MTKMPSWHWIRKCLNCFVNLLVATAVVNLVYKFSIPYLPLKCGKQKEMEGEEIGSYEKVLPQISVEVIIIAQM